MSLPNFTGMIYGRVSNILDEDYPEISYNATYYLSPKVIKLGTLSNGTPRVIRQRIVNDNQIDFVVSLFYDQFSIDYL